MQTLSHVSIDVMRGNYDGRYYVTSTDLLTGKRDIVCAKEGYDTPANAVAAAVAYKTPSELKWLGLTRQADKEQQEVYDRTRENQERESHERRRRGA